MFSNLRYRIFSLTHFLFFTCLLPAQNQNVSQLLSEKRVVIIMFDGFGMNYYADAPMPFLKRISREGFFKEVKAIMPSVTNANNASICCGNFPEKNGITGNSFLDKNNHEAYMESADLLMSPTLFERLQKLGIKSALVSSKKKSIALLSAGTDVSVSAETADSSWVRRLGQPPGIYSPDINYWTMQAALEILKLHPEIRCLYVHTTDYPMHMWAPGDSNSMKHLATMDKYIDQITKVVPDVMLLITADHDLNHKAYCVDLEKSLAARGLNIKIAISAERDKYLKHHRGFGGTSFVYLNDAKDEALVKKNLLEIKGVKIVLTRAQAAEKYHLMQERIGDLVVLADSLSVFGNLENEAVENLPANYRTHGSEYELRVPLLIYNAGNLPPVSYFQYNKDLTTWLFDEK